MGLETRNGHVYYYRKKRKGKKVVSEYATRGAFGELIAMIDRQERREAADRRAIEQWKRDRHKASGQALNEYERLMYTVARAALVASGCRTHRGQWRKRREQANRQ